MAFGKKKFKFRRRRSALDYIALPHLPEFDLDPETKRGIWVIVLIALGAIGALGLFDMAGDLGRYLNKGLSLGFGWGRFFIPFLIMILGYLIYNQELEIKKSNYFGLLIFVFSLQALLMISINIDSWETSLSEGKGGGYIGWLLANSLMKGAGFWGTIILIFSLLIISILLLFNTGLARIFGKESAIGKIMTPVSAVLGWFTEWRKRRQELADKEEEEEEEDDEDDKDEEEEEEEDDEDDDDKTDKEDLEQKKLPIFKIEEIKNGGEQFWWQEPTNIRISLPLGLLDGKKEKPTSGDIKEYQEIIKRTLENFGIPVEMGEVTVGPTVTQYTLKPAEGVKLSRITTLSNDLALALAAHPIRIEAPIPGKRLVGVEVPNQKKAMVSLKEVLLSKNYVNRKSNNMVALGKDVAGTVWLDDISKMPHLLVAGATNSGKSVCLNSIIVSLLYQNSPDELRFIMVDPKRVEMQVYNNIPYLLTPVITDAKNTIIALKWCLVEMEKRFDLLSKAGHRNIQTYNASVKIKMPYIVFIIDELADLMVAAAKDVEAGVIRLAQMARAVGIHLVLATQRPSVDIITGLIKSNMPARIAFSVASGTDSRTIIDTMGAEKLLGRGDMLYINAEMSKPVRLQGAFLSDDEIRRVVRYIKEKGGPAQYLEDVTNKQKVGGLSGNGFGDDGEGDDLYEEAKEIVINQGKASASFLQRKFSIGYNRAARLIDIMEQMGVVGPANGSKPREILISREQYEATITTGVSGVALHSREEAEAPDEFLNSLGEEAEVPPVLVRKKIDDDIDWEGEEITVGEEEGDENEDEAETEEEIEEEARSELTERKARKEIKKARKIEVTKNDDDPSYDIVKEEDDDGRYFSR
ncbi:MAG: DNA translocase SpoIIIE [Parcubacteria group bacterium ADurb.Bin316]|mgnify:FL=1|nr:MAG: DNA translocase SpoIIIE [Parcubacteria group bacterium ADurb.Bin316]HOZ55783.1 DNA translocase FtsK 4TM domain-containing protein [bacterium]